MVEELTDEQLRAKALGVLNEHLGVANTLRFLSWMRAKPRDYQTWRDTHFANIGANELIEKLKEAEKAAHPNQTS